MLIPETKEPCTLQFIPTVIPTYIYQAYIYQSIPHTIRMHIPERKESYIYQIIPDTTDIRKPERKEPYTCLTYILDNSKSDIPTIEKRVIHMPDIHISNLTRYTHTHILKRKEPYTYQTYIYEREKR